MDTYYTKLRTSAFTCEFDVEKQIMMQILHGCKLQRLRRKVLRENFRLDKIIVEARSFEMAEKNKPMWLQILIRWMRFGLCKQNITMEIITVPKIKRMIVRTDMRLIMMCRRLRKHQIVGLRKTTNHSISSGRITANGNIHGVIVVRIVYTDLPVLRKEINAINALNTIILLGCVCLPSACDKLQMIFPILINTNAMKLWVKNLSSLLDMETQWNLYSGNTFFIVTGTLWTFSLTLH